MRARCRSSKEKNYHGRGVIVCKLWGQSFLEFYNWAIANGYRKGLQIDRKDNDGNYEPSNCRWVTVSENLRNTRVNHKIGGKCITVISKELGGVSTLVQERLRMGWSIEDAVSKPKRKYIRRDKMVEE